VGGSLSAPGQLAGEGGGADCARSIADLTRAEEELRRANEELARSNEELERFAATIAHDLRAPLISISGCARLLLEDAGHLIPDNCREMLGHIEDSAKQLGRLVQALLEYSRAGQQGVRAESCSVGLIKDRVLDCLRTPIQDAKAHITWDTLPVVFADEMLVGVLLQNLIENALKYRSESRPEIHISVREDADGWRFSVRDNGMGIASEHHERIFEPFRRVSPRAPEYAGLGLGLATCKRIVARHGGRIWLESKPGEGSTFHFTLPHGPPQKGRAGMDPS
jgi:light-regulated signal transduction histidine kinase (bacteriophytochrome)